MPKKEERPFYRLPKWAVIIATIVAMMGGLSALGLSLPIFDLESKTHAASTYASKASVRDLAETLQEVRDNVIRLMERQGIAPIKKVRRETK